MGLLGKLESFGKAIWDTGKDVDVSEVGERLAGWAKRVGLNKFLRAANSPILDGGQLVIAGMKLTTGIGDPEDGERFGQGGARLHDAGATLRSAQPTGDWTGDGANSYSAQNVKQTARTGSIAAADHEVHRVLATEAYQVGFHRDRLDDWYDWLADVGLVTFALGLIPGVGQGLKAATEAHAVLAAVGSCSVELYQLSSEVEANAAALQQLVGRYENVAESASPSLTGVDQNPPPPPPPSAPPGEPPTDGPRDGRPDNEPTPPPEATSGNPGQSVPPAQASGGPASGGGGTPASGGAPAAPRMAMPEPPPAPGQVPSNGGGAPSAPAAPPAAMGGVVPGLMSAGAAPLAAASGVPAGLIEKAVQAALQREAEKHAKEDEEDKDGDGKPDDEEDEDEDGKPDEKKDGPVAAPGGIDAGRAPVHIEMDVEVERLTTPITVTVDRENPSGPPPAPAP